METTSAELKYLVERQREELKTITEVGRLLGSTTNPQEMIRLVATYLNQTFPLALCAVVELEQRKLQLIPFARIAQLDLDTAVKQLAAKSSDLVRRAVETAALTQAVDDTAARSAQWAQTPMSYLRSQHMAPLTFKGQAIGLLAVFSGKPEAFTREDQHAIDIVAGLLGASLRNALLVEELQRAGELKNELLMVISHELRIPLTSIKEGVNLVLDGTLGEVNADQLDFLKTVNKNTERLEGLVEKVLMATQVITNQVAYTFKDVDLAELFSALDAQFRPVAAAKEVTLELPTLSRPLVCCIELKRLRQALAHLLENAIQATSNGGRVSMTCADAGANVQLQIVDTGRGIPKEEQAKLFQQFLSVGGVNERKTGGLGLGLFITKAVIEVHGGTVKLDSEVGKGTTATVVLPKQRPAK